MEEQSDYRTDTVVSFLIITSSLLCLIAHVTVIRWILSEREMVRQFAYRVMVLLSLCDILQLITHLFTGVFTISNVKTLFSQEMAKILGAVAIPSYISYTLLTLLLTLNRLSLCMARNGTLFSGRKQNIWFLIVAAFFGLFFVVLLLPVASVGYDLASYSWKYAQNECSMVVSSIEMYMELGASVISALGFITIGLIVCLTTLQTHSSSKLCEQDILWVAMFVSAFCGLMNLVRYETELFFPVTENTPMALNFVWIVHTATFPISFVVIQRGVHNRKRCVTPSTQQTVDSEIGGTSSEKKDKKLMEKNFGEADLEDTLPCNRKLRNVT